MSAWGAKETKQDVPGAFRFLINRSNIGVAYRDHEAQEDLLAESELNWTILRPVGLTNKEIDEEVIISENNSPKPAMTISRKTVANMLLRSLSDSELNCRRIVISGKPKA